MAYACISLVRAILCSRSYLPYESPIEPGADWGRQGQTGAGWNRLEQVGTVREQPGALRGQAAAGG